MNAKSRSSHLVLPYPVLRKARLLLDQQLWCMGCDVRQPDFPLAEMGLRILRRPKRDRGCSRLTSVLPEEGHLLMWGFGILAYRPGEGAVWIRRQGFRPLHCRELDPLLPCWEHRGFATWKAPSDPAASEAALRLLEACAIWFAGFERQLHLCCGEAYRERCITAWIHQKRALPSTEMAQTWEGLASSFSRLRLEKQSLSPTRLPRRPLPRIHPGVSA